MEGLHGRYTCGGEESWVGEVELLCGPNTGLSMDHAELWNQKSPEELSQTGGQGTGNYSLLINQSLGENSPRERAVVDPFSYSSFWKGIYL